MPEVYFSRDAYSEIPMQVLFFTALWLLCDDSVLRRRGPAFVAGFCLGLLQAVRLDALSIVAALPVVCAAAWILRGRRNRREMVFAIAAAAAGVVLGLGIGFADIRFRSHPYLETLRGNVKDLAAATVLSAVASVALMILAPSVARLSRRVVTLARRTAVANIAAGLAIAVGLGAWLVRPALHPMPHLPDQASALLAAGAIVSVKPYVAHSVVWLGWYLGPVTLVLAIAGAALLIRATGAPAALGVVRRVGAARARGLPVPLPSGRASRPGLGHPAPARVRVPGGDPARVRRDLRRGGAAAPRSARPNVRAAGQAVAVALGLVAVLYPMWTIVHVRDMSEQHDFLPVVQAACKTMGSNAALVVVPERTSAAHLLVPVPVHTWCGIPTAQWRGTVDRAALEQAAARLEGAGPGAVDRGRGPEHGARLVPLDAPGGHQAGDQRATVGPAALAPPEQLPHRTFPARGRARPLGMTAARWRRGSRA